MRIRYARRQTGQNGDCAFIGAVYGVVAARLPAGWVTAIVAGMVNGVIWWVLGALVLMPLGLGMAQISG
jgi:hypothetical protein